LFVGILGAIDLFASAFKVSPIFTYNFQCKIDLFKEVFNSGT